MTVDNKFLFNFAVSYTGGGLKRLTEYVKWFNEHGGAWFIINRQCEHFVQKFPNNRFFVVNQTPLQRIVNDCGYLDAVLKTTGIPDLYFSNGIPMYSRVGRVNWFHVSNVLPLTTRGIPLSLAERLKFNYLGTRIKKHLRHADIASAESNYALSLLDPRLDIQYVLSTNGGDDELAYLQTPRNKERERLATVVGTHRYKGLDDSYRVFKYLKEMDARLILHIIGGKRTIPKHLYNHKDVVITGLIKRDDVIETLNRTRYFISTTFIENSSYASSEGVFIAEEAFLSDIGPHRELLSGIPYTEVLIPNMKRGMLHVKSSDITDPNLKLWAEVIEEMNQVVQERL